MSTSWKSLDTGVFHFINRSLSAEWLDPTMHWLSNPVLAIVVSVALTAWMLYRRSWRAFVAWLCVLMALGVADGMAFYILKPYFQLYRPCYALNGVRLLVECGGMHYGFPSNHAANVMAVAIFVSLCVRRLWAWVLTVGLAGLVGVSRIYLGVHFPSDVLFGFFVGGVAGLTFYALFRLYDLGIELRTLRQN